MKRTVMALGLLLIAAGLTGCHSGPQSVENMDRVNQEKAFRGDPERGAKIVEEMRRQGKLGGGPAGAPAPQAPR